jgi:NADH:ubiquinone oxidoreductase subunit E
VTLVIDYEELREDVMEVAALTNYNRASLIPVLRTVKEKYRGIDGEAMQVIADVLGCHPVEVNAVATFYAFLRPETQGRFIFRLCRTYSCELAGKEDVARQLARDLGVDFGETSADGAFSLEWANCMGMCDQGPAMLVNDEIYTKLTPDLVAGIVQGYKERPEAYATEPPAEPPLLGDSPVECGA